MVAMATISCSLLVNGVVRARVVLPPSVHDWCWSVLASGGVTASVVSREARVRRCCDVVPTPATLPPGDMCPSRHNTSLFLTIIVLVGMSVHVSSRPLTRSSRSSEDILAGVDFLSMFMNSATDPPQHSSTTTSPADITTTLEDDSTVTDSIPTTTEAATFVKDIPSAIVSDSKRNDFSVDESEPITINSNKPEAKVKRKSEDLLAIGANPDYIAQQQSRLHRDNPSYNHPYLNRQPSSRSRSVSYSAVIQSLPDESRINTPVISKPNNNHNLDDYDYTESYPDYNINQNKNLTSLRHVDSTAESKDYFVTRKYNPTDYNESTDKNRQGQNKPDLKKHYEPTERNWGLPEKNYEEPHRHLPTVYGKPEENYEVDEAVSVMTNGRAHGVQNKATEKPLQLKVGQPPSKPDDSQKVGYVVEGRNYRKYRVEERTADGFIVGEYGVVSNNDGSLRGVRYTADGTINPRVIYDALMKFLAL